MTTHDDTVGRAAGAARILVTGATGDIGEVLVRELQDAGATFRVMCRRPDDVDRFASAGVDAVRGDLSDPASLPEALEGCDQLFLLTPGVADQYSLDRNAIDAARAAGVRHVLRVSSLDAATGSKIPWARDHAVADLYLENSGLAWTRLQPGAFMKNILLEAPVIRRGWLPQTSGHGSTSWVDVDDIAAVAARVLTDPGLQGGPRDEGRAYVLTTDRSQSYPEIARILTEVLGRRVRYLHVPAPLFYLGLRAARTPRWQARGLVHQFVDVVRRGEDDGRQVSAAVPEILGRPARTIAEYVHEHRSALT